ncbi:hypothetical protein IE81DRAFT_322728 [Ceraceosorus guamensis]|uniref:tRNA-intron lyase n=1 Tax=Ceraceosorus guamensis TaxID=1522189 RepID=A0A316W0K8_9BASI|nr:hypothetical protein IE81DRAFT_322728 [Ceraceosorus guamensis]PWN43229.1 hypothetical protein IE81DRAFT_322728 [Ceraceosorus guamensis]
MPRGRHRQSKPHPSAAAPSTSASGVGTSGPSRVAGGAGNPSAGVSGKARSSFKNQVYSQALPVHVSPHDENGKRAGRTRPHESEGWWEYIAALVGAKSDKGKGRASQHEPPTAEDPQRSGASKVKGTWDPLTRSVWIHVTPTAPIAPLLDLHSFQDSSAADPSSARTRPHRDSQGRIITGRKAQTYASRKLWERGFFGKGTLSRSEPTWRDRKVGEVRVERERARGKFVSTPEELTAQRRRERKAAKIARARLAVRAGTQLPDGIVALGGELNSEDERVLERIAERELDREDVEGPQDELEAEEEYGKHIPGLIYLRPKDEEDRSEQRDAPSNGEGSQALHTGEHVEEHGEEEWIEVQDMEVLQLNVYEVFFLAGMLDVIEVSDERGGTLAIFDLYALLCSTTLKPVHLPLAQLEMPSIQDLENTAHLWARPDNPFLVQYVAYHHFRSLGWVVKSGIKFCVDFLLYKKGPVFSHAEFAILVIPSYVDSADSQGIKTDEFTTFDGSSAPSTPFIPHTTSGEKSWVWFSTMNRVQTQVLKTLVLAYVTVPRRCDVDPQDLRDPQRFVQRLKAGDLYSVREIAIRRWVPARMRA